MQMQEFNTSFMETDTIQSSSMKYFPSSCLNKYLPSFLKQHRQAQPVLNHSMCPLQ